MSAYIVDDKTINRVVAYLMRDRDAHYVRGLLKWDGRPEGAQALAVRMMALNVRSVDDRYEETNPTPLIRFTEDGLSAAVGVFGGEPFITRFQALKSLRCFLYQSCEGTCDKDPLYLILERYAADLALEIVSDLPAYDAAEWG